MVRLGGKIAFGLRTDVYEDEGFKEKQADLKTEGKWKVIERSKDFLGMPKRQFGKYNNIWVYEVI